jgi:hypothetical protein
MRISRSHTRDAYERNLAQIQPLTCGSLRFVEVPVAIVLVGVSVALCCRCRAQLLANVYNGGAVLGATECWINSGAGLCKQAGLLSNPSCCCDHGCIDALPQL